MTRPDWRRYLRFWGADVRTDVDDEIAFHLEMRTRDLMARGLDRAAAHDAALRDFGDERDIRREVLTIDERRAQRAVRRERVVNVASDLRIAARSLRKSPTFTAVAVLCIAIGVGASTAIFSAVNAALLRPLPYPDADELVTIYSRSVDRNLTGVNISYDDYASWREQNQTFTGMGIWTWTTYSLSGDDNPERINGAIVSPHLFSLLGIHPMLGRHFDSTEAVQGGPRVILLSHALWKRRFGGDSALVGKAVTVNGAPRTVVGIMPPNFNFPDDGLAWTPFPPVPGEGHGNRGYAAAIGRLKPGTTFEAGARDLAAISARLTREFPADNTEWVAQPVPLREDLVGAMKRPLTIFLGAVGLVLLIACANVANLMLARGVSRRQELAVRTALGAGRARIVYHVLAESLMIAFLGGALGVALAYGGVRFIGNAFPDGAPFYIGLGIDGVALTFAIVIAAGSALIFGVVPALDAARIAPQEALREGRSSGNRARVRLRSALVVGEVALAAVLLVGAALLLRSYDSLMSTNLGFREDGILSARISLPSQYAEPARRQAFFEQLYQRLGAIPAVQHVGSAQGIPFSGWDVQADMSIYGKPARAKGQAWEAHYQYVSPGYLEAIGAPILRGRGLSAADRDSTVPVGVINESFATQGFPSEDPVGQRVRIGGDDSRDRWITIVGVVRDFRHYRLPQKMGPALYLPVLATPTYSQTVVLQTTSPDPMSIVPAVRGVVADLDRTIPLYQVRTFEQAVSRSLWRQRFQAQVLGAFSLVALLLASVGIYGLVSWSVTQRTRELGLRIALGARRSNVVRLVVTQGATLAMSGIAIGIAGAFVLSRLLNTMLNDVTPTDPVSFSVVAVVLAAVTIGATLFPAWRAASVDPARSMRAD